MNVAFIPVRGGSKSIPLKNICMIAGKPLVYWTAKAANDCQYIDRVYIATDSEQIRKTVEDFQLSKVQVIGRGADTASDTASTESAMIEFAENYDFENIVLIQATSPLLTAEDLAGGFAEYEKQGTDSVLSVVRQKRFQWSVDKSGFASPINYDIFCRPRRQEFDGFLVENGAFYITGKKALIESKCRLSGNVRTYEMDTSTYFEIDEPDDWSVIEKQLENRICGSEENGTVKQLPVIKMFLTDCDGCLTDGGMYYSECGDELKKFNTKDGMGFKMLREQGILTGVLTGEKVELNRRRCEKLRVDIYKEGVENKLREVEELCKFYKINLKNVAYVGDDVNDIEVIRAVGFGCCVKNGMEEVRNVADYITQLNGGQGAVREVIEIILKDRKSK